MNRVHFYGSAEADIYLWQQKMRRKHSQLTARQKQEVAEARERAASTTDRAEKERRALAKLDEINERRRKSGGG